MADDYYPYLNRGSYQWVPDTYAGTTSSSFGVTDAYNFAVCNHGRHINMLAGEDAGNAFGTTVICRGISDAQGNFSTSDVNIYRPGDVTPAYIKAPFQRKIRRGTSLNLNNIPFPPETTAIGMKAADVPSLPFFFFSTIFDVSEVNTKGDNYLQFASGLGTGRIASLDIEYMLATSKQWNESQYHSDTNPPLAVLAVLDNSLLTESETWLNMQRPIAIEQDENKTIISESHWGPASEQVATDGNTQSILAAIQTSIGSGSLTGVYLPMYIHTDGTTSQYPELAVTDPGSFSFPQQADWSITARRNVNIKLSGTYWTNLENFPKIIGFAIVPSFREMEGGPFPPQQPLDAWNAVISGIRVYDALQVNTTPEHSKTTTSTVLVNGVAQERQTVETYDSQLPCKIFGYAWRISHSVLMSRYASAIQPSRGTLLTDNPKSGLGSRMSSFYFKIYHPDIPGFGVAHGVRFYYGLATLAIPGTTIGANSSLVGLLSSFALDMDWIRVQYIGPVAGTQSLTFQFGLRQYGDVGRTAYAGQFGYDKETVGTRCGYVVKSSSTDQQSNIPFNKQDLTWLSLDDALPSSNINGTKALFYDNDSEYAESKYYTFANVNALGAQSFDSQNFSQTYVGGFTPLVKGSPQTNLSGPGAFGMSVSTSSSFIGSEKITVYAKPQQYSANASIDDICSNDNNHMATFVSEVRATGSDVSMYGGTWRLGMVASTDSTLRMNSQIIFRFFFVPDKVNGVSVDRSTLNASALYQQPDLFEFHFKKDSGNYVIATGPPTLSDVISTPILTDQEIFYDLSWDAFDAETGDYVNILGDSTSPDYSFEKKIILRTSTAMPNTEGLRLVVQAWAVNFPIASNLHGVNGYYSPSSDVNYPATTMSWSGETESMFQTMILETRSGAILPQQDPYVTDLSVISYNYITTTSSEESQQYKNTQIQEEVNSENSDYISAPYRDYALWDNQLSFTNGKLTPFSDGVGGYSVLPRFGYLTDSNAQLSDQGRFSLVGFSVPNVSDLIEEQALIADLAFLTDTGNSPIIGGTSIGPINYNISFDYVTNNSTFDVRYVIELVATATNDVTTYLLARSGVNLIKTSDNYDMAKETAGSASIVMQTATAVVIPDPDAKLMLRFKIWPVKNRSETASFSAAVNGYASSNSFNPGFACIDIDNFKIELEPISDTNTVGTSGIEIIVGATTRGSSDWYEGLPTTTARTFGSADYYFVPDYDSTTTAIIPPLTVNQYGFWYLYGWMFSPFWFMDMPEGACVEIKDDAGLTAGNPITGTGYTGRERAQRVLMLRTAIDDLPLASVSSDMENARMSGKGILARQRNEISGAAAASNFLSIVHNIQDSRNAETGLFENMVNIGETIISGKNPLILTGSPNNKRAQYFYRGNASTSYLFYEEDSFDIDTHSSVVMLANYDGSLSNWHNPYGKRSAGTSDKVVFTNDMRLIGAAVDPLDFGIYMAGFRTNSLTSPEMGGTIVLKKMHPGLVFGTATASVGPLRIVDGLVTQETYNVTARPESQPVVPEDLIVNIEATGDVITNSRLNSLGDGSLPLPAAESFPDVMVDTNGNVYVYYTLLTSSATEATRALGKVFCRGSHNGGYWFDSPFPVADLGYEQAVRYGVADVNDESFEAKHVVAVYSDETKTYTLFFWAGGKIFMRLMPHPGIDMQRFKIITPGVDGSPQSVKYNQAINALYLIEGNTSFTDNVINNGLERWLKEQWDLGLDLDENQNNFTAEDTGNSPSIKIMKYASSEDVPPQRVGAVVNSGGEILLYYLNGIGDVIYKKIDNISASVGLTVNINTL